MSSCLIRIKAGKSLLVKIHAYAFVINGNLPKQILSHKECLHVFELMCPMNILSFSACSYSDSLASPWSNNEYSTEF